MHIDTAWKILLQLKKEIKDKNEIQYVSVIYNERGSQFDLSINERQQDSNILIDLIGLTESKIKNHIKCDKPFSFRIDNVQGLNSDAIGFLELYLPFALLSSYSEKYNQIFAISHFAQTLDGKIASSSGDSKWIGNDQNLVHAHRMRALCDAVLVGSRTVVIDNPKLNVRHVQGDNPKIVVMGGLKPNGSKYHVFDQDPIIITKSKKTVNNNLLAIDLDQKSNDFDTQKVLYCLYKKGLGSVYIEGGSNTTSCFLKQKTIDQVQIHISPKVLGSGLCGFSFEGIDTIAEAIEFNNGRFRPIDDHIMFLGELK